MLLSMMAGEIKHICRITFQGPNDLRHKVLIFIIVSVVRNTSRPSSESFNYISYVACFPTKFWYLHLISDSRFLFTLAVIAGKTGGTSGTTEACGFRSTVTCLTLRPLLILPSPSALFRRLLLRSHCLHSGSFIIRVIKRSSHCHNRRCL